MSVFGIAYKSGIPTYSQQQALMYIPAPPIQNPPGDTVKFSGASKFIANPYGDHWALIDIQTSSDIFQNINRFTVLDEKKPLDKRQHHDIANDEQIAESLIHALATGTLNPDVMVTLDRPSQTVTISGGAQEIRLQLQDRHLRIEDKGQRLLYETLTSDTLPDTSGMQSDTRSLHRNLENTFLRVSGQTARMFEDYLQEQH